MINDFRLDEDVEDAQGVVIHAYLPFNRYRAVLRMQHMKRRDGRYILKSYKLYGRWLELYAHALHQRTHNLRLFAQPKRPAQQMEHPEEDTPFKKRRPPEE